MEEADSAIRPSAANFLDSRTRLDGLDRIVFAFRDAVRLHVRRPPASLELAFSHLIANCCAVQASAPLVESDDASSSTFWSPPHRPFQHSSLLDRRSSSPAQPILCVQVRRARDRQIRLRTVPLWVPHGWSSARRLCTLRSAADCGCISLSLARALVSGLLVGRCCARNSLALVGQLLSLFFAAAGALGPCWSTSCGHALGIAGDRFGSVHLSLLDRLAIA